MSENEFYSRQVILKEVGAVGQKRIDETRCLIVGAGGLGHPAATYLAASGVGTLYIADFDKVEMSNLNRQVCFSVSDLGLNKAVVLTGQIKKQNPFIKVIAIPEKIVLNNVSDLISNVDLILDCTDNLETTFLLHDFSWMLKKDLIQASLYQYEGHLQVFNFSKKADDGCLRCLWHDFPNQAEVRNCQESGLVGAVAGVLGSMQALEAIKLILGIGKDLRTTTVTMSLLDLEQNFIRWKKNINCKLCDSPKGPVDLAKLNLKVLETFEKEGLSHEGLILIDLREKSEIKCNDYPHHQVLNLPLSLQSEWLPSLSERNDYLFLCQRGLRSQDFVKKQRAFSFCNFFSLHGGLDFYV